MAQVNIWGRNRLLTNGKTLEGRVRFIALNISLTVRDLLNAIYSDAKTFSTKIYLHFGDSSKSGAVYLKLAKSAAFKSYKLQNHLVLVLLLK